MIGHVSGGKDSIAGKRVAISGSGNVAQFAALKVIELGGSVVSLSDSQGCLIALDDQTADSSSKSATGGFTPAEIQAIAKLKFERHQLASIASAPEFAQRFRYISGARPWTHVKQVDVAIPAATQNEVSGEEAEALIAGGCKFIAEGSNMGCTQAAIDVFEAHREANRAPAAIWYAPGKAVNAGGVAVSGLEMAQNSTRLRWTADEVDARLKQIMKASFTNGLQTALEYVPAPAAGDGILPSLVAGSNIAGFKKVVAAMREQGDWW